MNRNQRITHYLPLVEQIARRLFVRLPHNVTWDELTSAGYVGLIEAVDRYDDSRNTDFSTFARPRIRGAMLDSLRELDILPRSMREHINALTREKQAFEQQHGRSPDDRELATVLKVPLRRVRDLLRFQRETQTIPVDSPRNGGNANHDPIVNRLIDEDAIDGLTTLELKEAGKEVRAAFDALPDRLRMVIVFYYIEELTMREIAEMMSLTVGRISQLRSEALVELRRRLRSVGHIDERTLSGLFAIKPAGDS